ncbi:antichymotrypsin-2-like [Diorhabda carinulata]|uniref:antichymotrypsin-2-like n=1 Tax=Diorhabda carinulata TaxID=1163345 RepID=UPI0025A299C2|nr:antichymotrypsin-2-like [Diorhabda carinulata]XP_057662762.1 antichymotrypsin-2-like [Diorhabda carinulata]
MKFTLVTLLFFGAAFADPPNLDESIETLATGNRLFNTAVYKETLKTNKGNIIFSPFSAATVLSLASEGAKNVTKSELIEALHLSAESEKNQEAFKQLLPKLSIQTPYVSLLSANKIYADDGVTLEDAFKKIAVNIYRSDVENVKFAENIEAAIRINRWVEDQTRRKIKNLIESDEINADTVLVLVNALYLRADWFHPFTKSSTHPQKFYRTTSDFKEVDMMHNVALFGYYENTELNTRFINLRFKYEGLSMVIALHNEIEGITTLQDNLEEVFKSQPWKPEFVDLKLPKFSISSSINFVNILRALGVEKIFDEAQADLSGLSTNRKNLYVSNVIQKAFINVTEIGSEAAAASAIMIQTRSGHMIGPNRKIFHADHPFIFYIKYHDVILFTGRYTF